MSTSRRCRYVPQHGGYGAFGVAQGKFDPWVTLLVLGVISGAIVFHLFTPLGIAAVNADRQQRWR